MGTRVAGACGFPQGGAGKTENEKDALMETVGVSLADRFGRAEDVVGRDIAGEYILVRVVRSAADLDSIYHLNRVGAFVWERLDGCTRGEEIVRGLTERFEVDDVRAANDYRFFLAQLESVRVVTRCEKI